MAKSLNQILQDLASKMTPVVRRAFLAAIQDIVDNVVLKDLIKAVEANDYERAFRLLGFSNAAMRPMIDALQTVFQTGGDVVGGSFPARLNTPFGRVAFRFDIRTPRAEAWLQESSSRLVQQIGEDARINIRNTLMIGTQTGTNPRTTALNIVGRIDPQTGRRMGGLIGLTDNQELWVRNARADLMNLDERYFSRLRRDKRFDSIVRKAILNKEPLDEKTIAKLIARYKDSLLKLRGETIARTETIQSLNRSQFEAYGQAIDMGATKRNNVRKAWDTTGDGRVRHDHRAMDGQTVGFDEPFKAPDGSLLMFPGDISLGASAKEVINCRCNAKFKVDWIADID